MSKSDFATTTEAVSPETMIKRVFGVARLLAAAKHQRDAEDQGAENPVKKQRQDELRYREDDLTTHTA